MKIASRRLLAALAFACAFIPQFSSADSLDDTRSDEAATISVLPIVGRVEGLNGSHWDTDVRLLNVSGQATDVRLDFYPTGIGGHDAPRNTRTLTLAAGEQHVLNGWRNIFPGSADGTGAVKVISARQIVTVARIYDDQRATGGGTFGQFVEPRIVGLGLTGALPMLSNDLGGGGFRTNIGWFNDSDTSVMVTFRAHVPGGESNVVVATAVRSIASYSHSQETLNQLFPDLEPYDHLYVTFEAKDGPLHVYASVIDNVTNDPIYIAAQ